MCGGTKQKRVLELAMCGLDLLLAGARWVTANAARKSSFWRLLGSFAVVAKIMLETSVGYFFFKVHVLVPRVHGRAHRASTDHVDARGRAVCDMGLGGRSMQRPDDSLSGEAIATRSSGFAATRLAAAGCEVPDDLVALIVEFMCGLC